MVRFLSVWVALFCAASTWMASSGQAQPYGPESTLGDPSSAAPRKHRLFTIVPRAGVHLGTWGATLRNEIRVDERELGDVSMDASGNVGALLGAEALFRLRSGFRLGAGVLVMPALSFEVDPPGVDAEGEPRDNYDFTAGTLVRVPGVFEWEFTLSDPVSLVVGVIPSILVLARGEQAKNWGKTVCPEADCKVDDAGVGLAIEGELGVMYWVSTHALRADVRFGLEVLETAGATEGDVVINQNLVGPRMSLLLGFEL